ncbi:hypothetical protein EST38_g3204 [Candolleomyces aberdarensis]|uniref:Uncharacterized protein n=1 Tax=Candolleomyces aberdarensis TaxID=2316362 RepID=A0A4Q2DR32_9AGAR|nr:hypothetical protein EST38_g3204 [Candolleomyces aberdarensis]
MSPFFGWASVALSYVSVTVVAMTLSTPPRVLPQRSPTGLASLLVNEHPHGTVNNSYIVMLKDDIHPDVKFSHLNFLQTIHQADPLIEDVSGIRQVYDGHIHGYAGRFTERVLEQLRARPEVAYIERDQIVHTNKLTTQRSAPWGLGRISHRPRLSFSTFDKYEYDDDGGDGVDVYVIDTGININHVEFEGRASWGKTIPDDEDEDGNGHGSHCAGTIASRKYGVAKKANIIAVKVLGSNGSGTMSDVIAGVVWATSEARKKDAAADREYAATGKTNHKGSVANMSLGGGKSQALDDTVNKAVSSGVHFAVVAGNDNRDACNYSPAAAENAITVGASTLSDERTSASNHGPCVDVFAPGLNILSTFKGTTTATSTLSGTSMASSHVAGLLAYLLSIYPSPSFDPTFDKEGNLKKVESQCILSKPSSLYSLSHSVLPEWIAVFMPSPLLVEAITAPAPKRTTLTPLQLKKALIALSSKGMLSELPDNTINLLVFNNATSS